VAYSPDGKRILSGSWSKLQIWDAETHQEVRALKGHTQPWITCVAYSPDGKRIASGSGYPNRPGELKIWDADTGKEVRALQGHTQSVICVAFSPDGKRLVSGSGNPGNFPQPNQPGELKIWDADTGQEVLTLKGQPRGFPCVAYSPDGKRIVSGSEELKIWDANTGQEIRPLNTLGVTCVAYSPDGKRVVAAGMDGTLRIWDADKGQ
jgi:WD40 repeat protein